MPPPPSARVQASCRNLVPSMSSMAWHIESCASLITFSNFALVLRKFRQRLRGQIFISRFEVIWNAPAFTVYSRPQKGARGWVDIQFCTNSLKVKTEGWNFYYLEQRMPCIFYTFSAVATALQKNLLQDRDSGCLNWWTGLGNIECAIFSTISGFCWCFRILFAVSELLEYDQLRSRFCYMYVSR
jgi:hypothetical protein